MGQTTCDFYKSSSHYDDLAWAAIWLAIATGDNSYLDPVDGYLDELDEWNYLNGSHTSEEFGYFVLEAGNYRVGDIFINAGAVTEVTHEWKAADLDYYSFDGSQTLLTQVVTYNGSSAVTTRLRDVYRHFF